MQDEKPAGKKGIARFSGKGHRDNELEVTGYEGTENNEVATFEGDNHIENKVKVEKRAKSKEESEKEQKKVAGDSIATFSGKGHCKNDLEVIVGESSGNNKIATFEGEDHTGNKVKVTTSAKKRKVSKKNEKPTGNQETNYTLASIKGKGNCGNHITAVNGDANQLNKIINLNDCDMQDVHFKTQE